MNKNKKTSFKKGPVASIRCKCGKTLFKKIRTNYPFGKKSEPRKTKFYRCTNCGFRSN